MVKKWNSVVQGAIHYQILNKAKPQTAVKQVNICIIFWERWIEVFIFLINDFISILGHLFVFCLIFASEACVFPVVLSSPYPVWLWSIRFFIRTSISQSILQIISSISDSVCHLFVTHMVSSGLCSFLSTLLWIRDHLRRLSSSLLSSNVFFGKVEFHVLALVYLIQIWANCSLLWLLKKKFHRHALWEHLCLNFLLLGSFYSLLKRPFFVEFNKFVIELDAWNIWMLLCLFSVLFFPPILK